MDEMATDLLTENGVWSLTESLMQRLDEYYSEQITFSPDVATTGYQTEEEEAGSFMDDYDDDDIPDRERLFAVHSHVISSDKQCELMVKQESITLTDDNTRITHSTHNSSLFSPNE